MKTLFSIPMGLAIAITGIVSCRLFEQADYDLSALLTIASLGFMTLWVSMLSSRKIILR
jgi:hypothetical protein